MSGIAVKICGLTDAAAVEAAVAGGARWLGFVFYPPSPRHLTPDSFRALRGRVPAGPATVGVFVDPADEEIARVLDAAPLDLLQLHGREPPARVRALRARFGLPVIKALQVATAEDLAAAHAYRGAADLLLFDARPPRGARLPGGNAVAFDWRILAGFDPGLPWLLAGGLHAGNLARAVRVSGARRVDVSSGVERAPGIKDPERIRALLALARGLDPDHMPRGSTEAGP